MECSPGHPGAPYIRILIRVLTSGILQTLAFGDFWQVVVAIVVGILVIGILATFCYHFCLSDSGTRSVRIRHTTRITHSTSGRGNESYCRDLFQRGIIALRCLYLVFDPLQPPFFRC